MGCGPLGQVGKGDRDRQGEEEGREGNTVIRFHTKRTLVYRFGYGHTGPGSIAEIKRRNGAKLLGNSKRAK